MKQEEYRKILSDAIESEIEANKFYLSVSEKVKDKALKTLFLDIAGEEIKHRDFLKNFMAKDLKAMHFDTAKDYRVTDSLRTPRLTPDMKPLEGLVLAIKKELESMMMVQPARECKYRCRAEETFPGSCCYGTVSQEPA